MPHAIEMKDGKILTPFGIRDLLDAVQDYAGEELRREIEEYIETNVQDIDDYEKEYDRMDRELDMARAHQRQVLCNIMEEVDALDILLHDDRLNRRRKRLPYIRERRISFRMMLWLKRSVLGNRRKKHRSIHRRTIISRIWIWVLAVRKQSSA